MILKKKINRCSVFFLLSFYFSTAIAGPWMTGPLLAPAGHTIPKGHFNMEPYVFFTDNFGIYNHGWKLLRTPETYTVSITPVLTWGLTDSIDMQITAPYNINWKQGQENNDYGDFTLQFGFQLLNQREGSLTPDLRVSLQESFPSGRFRNLNPGFLGTDATGAGSYQTAVGLNFQKVIHFYAEHYLRTRLSLTYTVPTNVKLRGFTSYGGAKDTEGTLNPANQFSADLAFEYTLTENWVPVFEVLFVERAPSKFNGNPGLNEKGLPPTIGHGEVDQISLAPAIEYNFSGNLGIIAGIWFTILGRESQSFVSGVIAINYYI